jgi:hypothetical protein
MRIDLQIDRLMLEGVTLTPRQRVALGGAVQAELSRLLRAGLHPSLSRAIATPSVPAANIRLGSPVDAVRAGVRIAHAVYAGIGAAPNVRGGKSKR